MHRIRAHRGTVAPTNVATVSARIVAAAEFTVAVADFTVAVATAPAEDPRRATTVAQGR